MSSFPKFLLGDDGKRERSASTFSVENAQQSLWNTYPEQYFQTYECISELHGIFEDPSVYHADFKETMRKDTNTMLATLTNKMFEKGFTTPEKIAENIDSFVSGMVAVTSYSYELDTKYMVQYGLYCKTLKNLGTERHRQLLLDGCSLKTFGCLCLTELGHGSNVRGIETTAEYDKSTKEFILNSPTETSMKFWIGNLAKTCQNAVVFAQLIIEEGGKKVNKGVHVFACEIRDRRTHHPHPGLEIGDCGHKKGLNGIDNGWIMFKNYRIPREGLLNNFGDVSEDGVYTTPIENDGKRFANSIASLSGGRVLV